MKRTKTLTQQEFFKNLCVRNKGLDLSGCKLIDIRDLDRKPWHALPYRLVIFDLDEVAMSYLRPKKGLVFFALEETRFLWPELKQELEEAKKRKFNNI